MRSVVLFFYRGFLDDGDVTGQLIMAELPRNALDAAQLVLAMLNTCDIVRLLGDSC